MTKMYEPFAGNYVWNLSVNLALAMGANVGEIEGANALVMGVSQGGDDAGTTAFFDAWTGLADRLVAQAEGAVAQGHALTASEKYRRACAYYMTAERMQARDYGPRKIAYAKMLSSFAAHVRHGARNCEQVEIPYEGKAFPALLTLAPETNDRRRSPCMVFCNGLDSVKEMVCLADVGEAFAARGVSSLIVDQPGVGDSLRNRGFHAVIDTERWASAAVDYLQSRAEIDSDRIGMAGWSLGGYFSPRAAAFEKRFKLCVAWGANHCWGELQKRRQQREGKNPVPHYWDHVMWVWGQPDIETYMRFVQAITLDGVVDKITVPFLITHGSNDRQIPIEYAHRSYEQAVNSPDRELHIFTREMGGVEHCSADNMAPNRDFIADWVADRFARMV